jgi:hypothetical protein
VHVNLTDISTSVMLGANEDAASSPVSAFAGEADMINQTSEGYKAREKGWVR